MSPKISLLLTTAVLCFFSPLGADPDSAPTPAPDNLDLSNWHLEVERGATATLTTAKDGPNDSPSLVIAAQTGGSGELWLVQLNYSMSVVQGKKYHLKFLMKAEPAHYACIGITQAIDPYASLFPSKSVSLNETWQEVTYDFTPKTSESSARLLFTNLNEPGAKYYIANVTLSSE